LYLLYEVGLLSGHLSNTEILAKTLMASMPIEHKRQGGDMLDQSDLTK